MTVSGISSYGLYIPQRRMDRRAIAEAHAWAFPHLRSKAKGRRSFCSWDEDSITMAVEAARVCLGERRRDAANVVFASTTPVYADLQNASVVGSAIGISKASTFDVTGSQRAGTSALLHALRSAPSSDTLITCAESRRATPGSAQEMQYGAGAVALSVSTHKPIAKLIGAKSSINSFLDHFRASDSDTDYYWEERWIRDEGYAKLVPPLVGELLADAEILPEQIAHFCLGASVPGADKTVANILGIQPAAIRDSHSHDIGNLGAAQPLLLLAAALDAAKAGDYILVVGFGAGCDVILLRVTAEIDNYKPKLTVGNAAASGTTEKHYLRLLANTGQLKLDWGMRAERDAKTALTQLYRSSDQINAFVGGECSSCNTTQYPVLPACVACGTTASMKPVSLVDAPAKVMTCTKDWLQYSPSPPLCFGFAQFDNGARVLMEFVDTESHELKVGIELSMVFRVKDIDEKRGFKRYFWKATPINAVSRN